MWGKLLEVHALLPELIKAAAVHNAALGEHQHSLGACHA